MLPLTGKPAQPDNIPMSSAQRGRRQGVSYPVKEFHGKRVVSITGRDLLLKLGVASCRLHNDCPGKTSWRYNAWRCCYGALAGIWFSRHPRAGSQVYWTKVQYTSFNSPVYASILKLPIAYRRTYRFGAPANQTMTVFRGCLHSPGPSGCRQPVFAA